MSIVDIVKGKIPEQEQIVYAKLKRHASMWFEKMAQGSSRDVYDAGDYVIKVAKNVKGIAQNEVESNLYNDGYAPSFLAEIIYTASDNSFLIMEKCKKVTRDSFKSKAGFSLKYLFEYLIYTIHGNYSFEQIELSDESDEFLSDIHKYVTSFGVDKSYTDLERPSSWGINRNGDLVLIDYGLNNDVAQKHYNNRRK